ncbi:MAG: FAD-dependent oxidoreductase [Aristaeellaceae bacterium]
MKKFNHISAGSYEEASRIVREGAGKIDPIAGGTDLLGTYKDRLLLTYPEAVVSMKNIPHSDYVRDEGDCIAIGAGTTLRHVADDPLVKRFAPAVGEAAYSVASPIIRTTATIGGNVCQDVRCWYYRYPDSIGGRLNCRRKGGDTCYAIAGENRYHSIFGGMSTGGCSSCQQACPAGTDIASYMARIREGDWEGAARLFMRYNPMPMMTSRICPHLCQDKCNQRVYGEAVNIPAVERSLGDYILAHREVFYAAPEVLTGKKTAVIGAGPGGLTAAYYLRKAGHEVTVYDAHEKPGGVLRYGIPHYRLPKAIVDAYCDALEGMGVRFVMNTRVGRDVTVEDIRAGVDAVYVGTGAWSQPVLGLDGEKLTSFGLNFLEEVNTYLHKAIGEEVLVCGGGNVAMDVALTACRLGAKKVRLVCLEQRKEMPASEEEILMAEEEGVELFNGWGLGRVVTDENGRVTGLEAKRCLAVRDESGRFSPSYDEADTMVVPSDFIVLATGQRVDVSFLGEKLGAQLKTARGLIDADAESGRTREEGYYAGGDAVTGPNLAIRAIRAGRAAAASMNRDLGAAPAGPEAKAQFTHFDVAGVEETRQHRLPEKPAAERTLTGEDRASLDMETTLAEARRCLNCACYAVNASDLTPVLVMLDAQIRTTERVLSARELFTTRLTVQQVLHFGELVTEIRVPKAAGEMHYDKRRVRDAIDFALVSLASRIVTDENGMVTEARLVFGGVAPVPRALPEVEKYLLGKKLTPEVAREAGEIALKDATPMSCNEYKVFMAKDVIYNAVCRAGGVKQPEIPVL